MHMVLELTANGDPIGSTDLQVLAEQIINAPVGANTGRPSVLTRSGVESGKSLSLIAPR
jgi:hypothetical protein